jgi:hypothetical protein
MYLKLNFVAIMLVFAALPGITFAQVNDKFANMEPQIAEARAVMATDRKVLIRSALGLTAEEEKTFWTAYREYSEDRDEVNKLRLKIITDFAANEANFTDDIAKQMLKDYFKFEEDRAKVKKKHHSKFNNMLSEAKVARFYQIESKLDAIINFALAMEVPMIEPQQ